MKHALVIAETFYKRYPRRALNGMAGLTLEERGLYGGLIDLMYEHGARLSDDDERTARNLGIDVRTFRRVKGLLLQKGRIRIEAGKVVDDRVEEQLGERKFRGTSGTLLPEALNLPADSPDLPGYSSENPQTKPFKINADVWDALSRDKIREDNIDSPVIPSPKKPLPEPDGVDPVARGARTIYEALDPVIRQRMRGGPPVIQRALTDRLAMGDDLGEMVGAALAYYRHPDTRRDECKFARSPALFFVEEQQRWREWIGAGWAEDRPVMADDGPKEATLRGRTFAVPPGRAATEITAMVGWAEDWLSLPAAWKVQDRGPRPGQPGCRLWPSVAEAFGIELAP